MTTRGLVSTWTLTAALLVSAAGPAALAQTAPDAPPPPDTVSLLPPLTTPGPGDGAVPPPAPPPDAGPRPGEMAQPLLDNGAFGNLWNADVGHAPFRAQYRVTWFPSEGVAGQPTSLGFERQEFSFSFPLWHLGTSDDLLGTLGVRNELFQTHAVLPDTHQPFPDELWSIRLGLTYRHLFDNGWVAGGSVNVGSASDRPFHSLDEVTVGMNAFLRVPSGERNAWLFSLTYSPTGELPFPIPGIAYVWQPTDTFRAHIGLPAQLWWRATDDLTFDLSYMLLTTVHARATYRVAKPVRVYLAYASENEGYLLADRLDENDRFRSVAQRVTAGTVINFSHRTALDLSGGYVFGRYFFEGRSISSGTQHNRIDVDDGAYVSAQFQIRW